MTEQTYIDKVSGYFPNITFTDITDHIYQIADFEHYIDDAIGNDKVVYILRNTKQTCNLFEILKAEMTGTDIGVVLINSDNMSYLQSASEVNKHIIDKLLNQESSSIECKICATTSDNHVICKQCGEITCNTCVKQIYIKSINECVNIYRCPYCKYEESLDDMVLAEHTPSGQMISN